MPTYEYECPQCTIVTEVVKPMSYSDSHEICPSCKNISMTRILSATRINTSNCQFEAHHNWAFGKVIKSKNHIKDEIRRINDETGKQIVEVGNDKMGSLKVQRKEYTLD